MSCYQRNEYIVSLRRTWGSETSQYPKEEKSTETPLVAASERGIAQTIGIRSNGVVGPAIWLWIAGEKAGKLCQRRLQPRTQTMNKPSWYLSTARHVESRGNLGEPSSKAKY